MPRELTFILKDIEIPASMTVFSRDTVYGTKSVERRGERGELYRMVNLTSDGMHIIPSGGIGSGYTDADGNLVPRTETRYVDEKQEPLYVTRSMYTHPIELGPTISLSHFFDYNMERTYLLVLEDKDKFDSLLKECIALFKQNKFLRFTYAYYDTTEPLDAILIPKEDDIFVLIGKYEAPFMVEPAQIEYWDEEEIDIEQELLEFDVW